MGFPAVKRFTNAFILDEVNDKILLGYKKRGFAQGIYNGFGGKVDIGETPLQAAHRELEEEAGVQAPLQWFGALLFYQTDHEYAHYIDLYRANSWSSEPIETEEMKPRWFALPDPSTDMIQLAERLSREETSEGETHVEIVPLHKMWRDDLLWMPLMISNKPFVGRVDLVQDSAPKAGSPSELLHPLAKWWIATIVD